MVSSRLIARGSEGELNISYRKINVTVSMKMAQHTLVKIGHFLLQKDWRRSDSALAILLRLSDAFPRSKHIRLNRRAKRNMETTANFGSCLTNNANLISWVEEMSALC